MRMGPSYNWRSSVKDLRRVLRYEDVLSRVGKKMLQTGTRIAIPAGFAAVGAFAGGQGQEGINPIDALYLPGIASLGLIASGLTCMVCLLYTSPSPRDLYQSRMPSSA